MTFDKLAKLVALAIQDSMREEGFDTFREMQKSYMWDASDIQDEICYHVKELDADCYDDMSVICIGEDEMKYGQFKRMVMSHLR